MFILLKEGQYVVNQFNQVMLFRNADEILSYCIKRYDTNIIDHNPKYVVVWPSHGSPIYLERIKVAYYNV